MAASTEQKVDFLLKKIGYTASKTGSVSGTGAVSGTSKQPFGEAIPSPLVVPSTSVWADSSLIPSTPPTTSTFPVGVNTTGSAYQLTHDATASGSSLYRSFVARSTHGNQTASIDGNWIDSQFGADYAVRVFVGAATNSSNEIPQAGTSSDAWFFDYSSGVLNFNDTNLPAGITTTNVYLVGYRYTGGIGVKPVTGIGTFSSLHVTGIATFKDDVEFHGVSGIASAFWDKSNNRLELKDNVLLTFGNTRDLQISHDGADSIIKDAGVGRLKILGGFQVKNVGDTQTLITANTSGANATNVELYHSNVKRLETLERGVGIGGSIHIDNDLYVTGISTLTDDVRAGANLSVAGLSTFTQLVDINGGGQANTFKVEDLTAGRVTYAGTGGELQDSGNLTFDGTDLTAASAKISDLTDNRVVLAGTSGALEDSGNLTFDANSNLNITGGLVVSGITTLGSVGISTGLIKGPATMYIDPATVGDNTGLLVVKGNLQVDGTQTTVNSATMTVTDKNIEIAKGAANDAAADGAGITIDSGDGDKTLNWVDATDAWTSSEHIQVAAGKQLGFADDPNTYIDRPAADNIRFTTGGSVAITIDENQNIGIGTANPASDLHINTPVPTIRFTDSDTAQYSDISQSGHSLYISGDRGASGSGGIIFRTQGTDEKVRITSDGKLGIGTDDPSEIITGIGTTNPSILLKATDDASSGRFIGDANRGVEGEHLAEFRGHWNGTGVARIVVAAGNDTTNKDNASMRLFTAEAGTMIERLRIKQDGIIETGTAIDDTGYDDNQRFRIGRATDCNLSIRVTGNTTGHTGIVFGDSDDPRRGLIKYDNTGDYMSFHTNGTDITTNERLRIKSDGKVGIGTENPGELLDVYKTSNNAIIQVRTTTAGAWFEADSGSSGYYGLKLSSGGTQRWLVGSYGTNNFTIKDGTSSGGDERFTIVDGTGNVGINSTTPTTTLDVRGTVQVSGISTFSDDVTIVDGKKILLGDSDDLQIWHDNAGGHSRIDDTGTGNLVLRGASGILLEKYGGGYMANFINDGSVDLYYAASKKFETLQRGVGIGGSIHIDNDAYVTGITTSARLNVTGITTSARLNVTGITTVATLNVGVSGQTLVGINTILDEDNMASDSATALATQQSIKAYVDTTVTAQDLDFAGDSGTGAVDLDSQSLTIAGTSNEIETSASGQTLTVGLPNDVTIANDLTVASNAGIGSLSVTGISTFNNDVEFVGQTAGITSAFWDQSAGAFKFLDGISLNLGNNDDIKLFHDGSSSRFEDTYGHLTIKSNIIELKSVTGNKGYLQAINGQDVKLYYNGNEKIRTTNDGTYTTGISTASGVINSETDVQINGTSVLTSALDEAVAMAIALG